MNNGMFGMPQSGVVAGDIKTGAGTTTGAITVSASALVTATTLLPIVTLPSDPGYVYAVTFAAHLYVTVAASGVDSLTASIAGRQGLTYASLNTALNTAASVAGKPLFADAPVAGGGQLFFGPGASPTLVIDTTSTGAGDTLAANVEVYYSYIGYPTGVGSY